MSTSYISGAASTPSDGFHYGGFKAQSQQQLQQPQQQQHTPQRTPSFAAGVGSSSSFMTSGELYASPSQLGSLMKRPSSFREGSVSRRSTSGGFGFSQFDVGQQASTPKNVRFEDAASFPLGTSQQSQSADFASTTAAVSSQQPNRPAFGQSTSSYSFHQPSYQQSTFSTTPSSQSRFQSSGNQPAQTLTMSDLQLTKARQPSASTSQSPWTASSSVTARPTQPTSVFTTPRLSDLSKPIAISSMPSVPAASTSAISAQRSSAVSALPAVANQIKEAVITPRSAITARIRWNVMAFLLTWCLPFFGPMNTAYWFVLTAAFRIFGGDADVHVATTLSWVRSALFILTFANIVEAFIRLQTGQEATPASRGEGQASAQKRKPSLAFPSNRTVSSSSPSSSSTSSAQQKPRAEPRHFAHNSPLRETIFRASVSAQQRQGSSSSPLADGPRLPSQTPSRYDGLALSGSRLRSSSPAAAYLARRQEQRLTSGTGQNTVFADTSFDHDVSGAVDLSTDSIEVTRAIRALSASYGREMSEVRSSPSSAGPQNTLVTA